MHTFNIFLYIPLSILYDNRVTDIAAIPTEPTECNPAKQKPPVPKVKPNPKPNERSQAERRHREAGPRAVGALVRPHARDAVARRWRRRRPPRGRRTITRVAQGSRSLFLARVLVSKVSCEALGRARPPSHLLIRHSPSAAAMAEELRISPWRCAPHARPPTARACAQIRPNAPRAGGPRTNFASRRYHLPRSGRRTRRPQPTAVRYDLMPAGEGGDLQEG